MKDKEKPIARRKGCSHRGWRPISCYEQTAVAEKWLPYVPLGTGDCKAEAKLCIFLHSRYCCLSSLKPYMI